MAQHFILTGISYPSLSPFLQCFQVSFRQSTYFPVLLILILCFLPGDAEHQRLPIHMRQTSLLLQMESLQMSFMASSSQQIRNGSVPPLDLLPRRRHSMSSRKMENRSCARSFILPSGMCALSLTTLWFI